MTAATTEPQTDQATMLSVDALRLYNALSNVRLFAGDDDTLPVLTSVHLQGSDQTLRATATDRYALARHTIVCGHGTLADTLLRPWDVKILRHTLKRIGGIVTLTRTAKTLTAASRDYSVTVPVYDGTFPDLSKLLDGWRDERTTDGVALAPRLLARFAQVEVDWDAPMRVWTYGPKKAVHVRIGDEFVGLVMPVAVPDEKLLVVPARELAVSQ